VITVVVSYRIGFDGFGLIEGAPRNRGLRDQLAALEWVRDEIGAFGGDASRVTVAGQSAGGGSVLALMASPAASGLFHRAMTISPAIGAVSLDAAGHFADRMATLAGVAADRDGFASVSEERLVALQKEAAKPERGRALASLNVLLEGGMPLGPVVDGDVLPRHPLDALVDGASAAVPLVIGATDDEVTALTARYRSVLRFVPVPLALAVLGLGRSRRRAYLARTPRKGAAAVLGGFATDRVFRATVLRVARARDAAGSTRRTASRTWLYRFAWASPVPSIGVAGHCLDVPFWFDHLDAEGVTAIAGGAPPTDLAAQMHRAMVAFVRDGDPGWPQWDAATRRGRVFGGAASSPPVETDAYAEVAPLV
jgi:para-nitrobenzyl esterase